MEDIGVSQSKPASLNFDEAIKGFNLNFPLECYGELTKFLDFMREKWKTLTDEIGSLRYDISEITEERERLQRRISVLEQRESLGVSVKRRTIGPTVLVCHGD